MTGRVTGLERVHVGVVCLIVAGGVAACGDDGGGDMTSPEPTTGTLEVIANTTGETPDENGYTVALDGGNEQTLPTNGRVTFTEVSEGEHQIGVSGLQVNCGVDGSNPRSVTVAAGETVTANVDLRCPKAFLGKIAFVSTRDGNPEVYTMDRDGLSASRFTATPVAEGRPDVSPDGTKVLFDRDGDIIIKDADRENLETLTPDTTRDQRPAYSPDGSMIAFESNRDGNANIYVMNADGSEVRQVTDNSASDAFPTWSPDGSKIAFNSDRTGNQEIFTINVDGTGLQQVTQNSAADALPAWSPDGSTLAFQSDRDGDLEIFTVGVDGSGLQQLTDNSMGDEAPDWSPDGSAIAFNGETQLGNVDIFMIQADGSTSRKNVSASSSTDFFPRWAPTR